MGKAESRIIIDSTHVGRFMGIPDLLVEAPTRESNDATGGTTESGISEQPRLVFTGTPKTAGFDKKVSIAVDLSIAGPGPDHAGPHRDRCAHRRGHRRPAGPRRQDSRGPRRVLTSLPGQKLPFGIAPTSEGARGSDIIIEGIAEEVTIALDEFNLS